MLIFHRDIIPIYCSSSSPCCAELLLATGGRGSSRAPAFYTYQDTVIIESHRSVVSRPIETTAAKITFVLGFFFWWQLTQWSSKAYLCLFINSIHFRQHKNSSLNHLSFRGKKKKRKKHRKPNNLPAQHLSICTRDTNKQNAWNKKMDKAFSYPTLQESIIV